MDYLSVCAELHRCLTTQEEQELIQITALVQDKQELSAAYLSIHSRSLVDSIIFYVPRGYLQLLLTLVWSMGPAAKVRTIYAGITDCINPASLIDSIILTPAAQDQSGSSEWHTICKEYNTTYKVQLPAALHAALSKLPSLWAKLCLLWMESQKLATSHPETDARKLSAALKSGDVDSIVFILGTADPATWRLTMKAFEEQEGTSLMSAFSRTLKRHDLVSCQLACQALLGRGEAAAFLLHRAVLDHGDHDRAIRATAFCHDHVKGIEEHYKGYGNLKADLQRVLREPIAHACIALWGML